MSARLCLLALLAPAAADLVLPTDRYNGFAFASADTDITVVGGAFPRGIGARGGRRARIRR